MTHFIAAILGWLCQPRTPPKSAGKHARTAEPKRPRPSRPTSPKPQTHPRWRDFVPPTPAADDPPIQDSATVVPPYPMTPEEVAQRRRKVAEATRQGRLAAIATPDSRRPAQPVARG
ncbi:hypothetical protein [Embleya sp. NPDC005971]|uniref:hypothetical protein n=1 Tax=Embleya sp. NPDC005971 TaxID=3156724 RepID=UPI0033C44512